MIKIITKYFKAEVGSCYLWSAAGFDYALDTSSTNYMKFDGYTLEEVKKKIEERGFKEIPLAGQAQSA